MHFSRVRIISYRNLADAEIDTEASRIFLVGENGQGKTNFLEALYCLSFGSSFRGSQDAALARNGSGQFSLAADTMPEDGSALPEETRIVWSASTKEIRQNGKPVRDRKFLVERNPSIVFCHEDFSFAAGEPERRRFFFDQTAGLLSLEYIDALRDYRRVLRQRNALLKEGRAEFLDTLDFQLAQRGLDLVRARSRLAADFSKPFSECFAAVSLQEAPVNLAYRSAWDPGSTIDAVMASLAERRTDELSARTSLSGPHRDRWVFTCEGQDYAAKASTGQLRLLSLVLRVVQAGHYTRVTGRLPVLLLDDVLLELDPARRQRFFGILPSASQAFFTFLPGEPWQDYAEADILVYKVEHGRIGI